MSDSTVIEGDYTENVPTTVPQGGVTIIQRPEPKALDLTTDEKLNKAVAQVQNALTYKERVMELAVKTARPKAIVDQDGVPYFTESECERILSLLGGGNVHIDQPPQRYDDEDGNFGYTATVTVAHPVLGSFGGFGSAHSTDKFLGTNNGRSRRQLADVDRHNIAQHALTRAKGSAIRRMLGLDGYTWEELESWGFDRGAGGSVTYGKGGGGSSSSGGRRSSGGRATGVKGQMIEAMKAAGLEFNDLSAYAEKMGWHKGKILEAPEAVMTDLIAHIQEDPDALRS